MTDLSVFAELVPLDHGLCVVSTLRGDGGVQSSVVNAGVLDHPVQKEQVVGFVATGGSRKLAHLRADPGSRSSSGRAGAGRPSRGRPSSSAPTTRARRSTPRRFACCCGTSSHAGGTHDDWDTYDRVMAEERRAAVLITPRRVYTNPPA